MSWSLADQAVMSVSNFVLMLVFSRILEPSDYGRLAITYGIFHLFVAWNGSIVIYPLTLQVAERPDAHESNVAGALGVAAVLAPAWATLTSACLWLVLGAQQALAAAFVIGTWILFDTARRALQVRLQHQKMLVGDLITYPGQVVTMVVVASGTRGSLSLVFVLLGCGFVIGAAVHMAVLRVTRPSWSQTTVHLAACRRLGSWRLAGDMTTVVTIVAYSWNVAFFSGLQAAASMRAIVNLTGLTHPLTRGIDGVLIPEVAHEMHRPGGRPRQLTAKIGGLGGGLVLSVLGVIALFPGRLLRLLYEADSPYVHLETELRLLCAVYTVAYLARVLNGYLGAFGRPREALRARLETVAFAVAVGHPMATGGLMWALMAMACTRLFAATATLRRIMHMERT